MDKHRERSIRQQIGIRAWPCPTCGTMQDALNGAGLRGVRERCPLSLREVARRARISPSYLSDLELGRRHLSMEQAHRLLEVMGL